MLSQKEKLSLYCKIKRLIKSYEKDLLANNVSKEVSDEITSLVYKGEYNATVRYESHVDMTSIEQVDTAEYYHKTYTNDTVEIDDLIDYCEDSRLLKILKSLNTEEKEIIQLFLIGYEFKEIAKQLNVNEPDIIKALRSLAKKA